MTPETFEGVNITLTSPENWDEKKRGLCKDLPVKREDGTCTSRWSLTPAERRAVYDGAHICVQIASGNTQPPISLTVEQLYLNKQTERNQ